MGKPIKLTAEKVTQFLVLKPPYEYSCERCQDWKRYPPYDGQQQNWGRCHVKEVPGYMQETYFSRGCNLHSSIEKTIQSTEMPIQKPKKHTMPDGQMSLL